MPLHSWSKKKPVKEILSFIRTSYCKNNYCSIKDKENIFTKLALNILDGNFSLQYDQMNLQNFIEKCVNYERKQHVTMKPTTYIMIELN